MNHPEFGSYPDNEAAYSVAMARIKEGDVSGGVALLRALEAHLLESIDARSYRVLFPLTRAALCQHDSGGAGLPRRGGTRVVGIFAAASRRARGGGPTLAALIKAAPISFAVQVLVWERSTYHDVIAATDLSDGSLLRCGPVTRRLRRSNAKHVVLRRASEGGLAEMAGLVSSGAVTALVLLLEPDSLQDLDILALLRAAIRENVELAITFRTAVGVLGADERESAPGHPLVADEGLAIVAHPDRKLDAILWTSRNAARIAQFGAIFTTGTTGQWVRKSLAGAGYPDASVVFVKSGPDGGDEQITELVLRNKVQHLVFLTDPYWAQPHYVAVASMIRNCLHRHLSVNLLLTERSASDWTNRTQGPVALRGGTVAISA